MFLNIFLKNGANLYGTYKEKKQAINIAAYCVGGFYSKPSAAKENAENKIIDKMNACNGYGYGVTGGNSCTFSAVWFVEIDGEEFQIRETASNTYIEGPKTITIQNAIEEEKAEKRRQKKELEIEKLKRNLQRGIDKQNAKAYILNIYDELSNVLENDYKTLYKILRNDAIEYIQEETEYLSNVYYLDWLDNELKTLLNIEE